MIGSNSTALRQHAYSVFTASRREHEGRNDIPESVLRPMAPTASSVPVVSPAGQAQPMPERVAEPKPWFGERVSVAGRAGMVETITPAPKAAVAHQPSQPPSQDEIRRRAHQIFESRCGEHGDPVADWLRAEAELRRERGLA